MDQHEVIKQITNILNVDEGEAEKILSKAVEGGEIKTFKEFEMWLNHRFLKNCVFINEDGYAQMCVNALKILSTTAATDYGSSRQRDLGQLWADMTRGYLGELAFALFLEKRWNIKAKLGHELGKLEKYLPMDIHQIQKQGEPLRTPNLKIGIKAIKWNGIWLDIPNNQFHHSDIHVVVKVGAGRNHLFAFFKTLSVFKDKVLKRGQEAGVLTEQESEELFNCLPSFKPIPAYICGFVKKETQYLPLSYGGRIGRKNFTITEWNGPIKPGDLEKVKESKNIPGKVAFEGIQKFSHDNGYLFNMGNLLWNDNEWEKICKQL